MFPCVGDVVLDLTKRLAIVPELVLFLDQKPVQQRAGGRIGLPLEPIEKMSDVLPRDELVHGPVLPLRLIKKLHLTTGTGKQPFRFRFAIGAV